MPRNIKNGWFGWFEKGALEKIETLSFKKQASCKLIYFALCSMSAKQKNSPIIDAYKFDLARFASVSLRTVYNSLPLLETLKIIEIQPQARTAHGKYKKVRITLKLNVPAVCNLLESCDTQLADVSKKLIKRTMSKKNFGELNHVSLTDLEHKKLLAKLGKKKTCDMIDRLDLYIASSGKKYKSHYATILAWERKDGKANLSSDDRKPDETDEQYYFRIGIL